MIANLTLPAVVRQWSPLLLLASALLLGCQTSALWAQATAAKPKAAKPKAAKPKAAVAKKPVAGTRKPTAARKTTTAAKKPAARKPATSYAKAAPRKAPAAKTAKRAPVRRTTRRQAATAARPRVPLQPSAERLIEIQTALASAGYLRTEPTGKWDDNSIAAMKRFQEEHSIPATGKINSLSLIALGLGPERGASPGSDSVLEPNASGPAATTSSSADR